MNTNDFITRNLETGNAAIVTNPMNIPICGMQAVDTEPEWEKVSIFSPFS